MKLGFAAKENLETKESFLVTTNPMTPEFANRVVPVLRDQCKAIGCPHLGRTCKPEMVVDSNVTKTTARIIVRNQLEKFYIATDDLIHLRERDPDRVNAYWSGNYGKVGRACPLPTIPEIGV